MTSRPNAPSLRRSPALLWLSLAIALACASETTDSATLFELEPEQEAKLAPWDQARVTSIAEQFAAAANDVYVSVNTLKTGSEIGSGQAKSFIRLKDRVRVARNEARHLATQLRDGGTRLETVNSYERLMALIRDARVDGQRMFIAEPTLKKISAADDLLRQLAPYYDPNANAGS